jgi:hypothetical protein
MPGGTATLSRRINNQLNLAIVARFFRGALLNS